jgi:hypothetical protein
VEEGDVGFQYSVISSSASVQTAVGLR